MCLLVLAWQVHPRYQLVVAANRDEFYERPTVAMAKWPAPDDIIGGRDLRAGGTWLAMTRDRRFGIVTNFRELQGPLAGAPSRGNLIPGYLRNTAGTASYLQELQDAGVPVHTVGKAGQLFSGVGIDVQHPGATNLEAMGETSELLAFLDAQRPPLLAIVSQHRQGATTTVQIQFTAPSPTGLLPASATQ